MGVSDGDSFSYVLLHCSYISAILQLYYNLNPKPMVIG